jgi:WD40 repeat protein
VFSPDGRTLASAGFDSTIRLWDAITHQELGSPISDGVSVLTSVAFSPDGRTLASGDSAGEIRLWDVNTQKPLVRPLAGHAGYVSVAFSRDGRSLVSAGADGAIRLWGGLLWRSTDELQREVCGLLGSGLSPSEWDRYAAGVDYRQSCP